MNGIATGKFEVSMAPQQPEAAVADSGIGRLLLDKHFSGDLEGTSQGQMISFGTATEGSAGYVAIEHVSGSLNGRKGTFALQHFGLMNRGMPQLRIVVVPDSGTDQLTGLSGEMSINIADGQHTYNLDFTLLEGSGI